MSTVVASEKGGSKVTENSNRHYILMALAPMIAGIIVFTALSFVGVAENKPPVASFTFSPSSPSTADMIQFTDTSSDEDGEVVSWSWDFGDGTTSTLQNPTHQYSASGTYTVTLTVTDDGGATDSESQSITVSLIEIVFQDFELGNGTPSAYFYEAWRSSLSFEDSIFHGGTRSVRMEVPAPEGGDNGATIDINVAAPSGYVDMRDATILSVWVYDTQGNNTVQLRLKDSDGTIGPYQWSTTSVENQWTKVTWDLEQYPTAPNLDWEKIASIELYEWNEGTYYFDDAIFTSLS